MISLITTQDFCDKKCVRIFLVLLCCYLLLVVPDHHPPLPGPGDHPQIPSLLLLPGHAPIARHLAGLGALGQHLSRGKVRLLIQGAEDN